MTITEKIMTFRLKSNRGIGNKAEIFNSFEKEKCLVLLVVDKFSRLNCVLSNKSYKEDQDFEHVSNAKYCIYSISDARYEESGFQTLEQYSGISLTIVV